MLTIIPRTNLSPTRNMEFFSVIENIIFYAQQENLELLKLVEIVDKLVAVHSQLDAALVSYKAAAETERLELLDNQRDKAYRALVTNVDLYTNYPEKNKLDAASLIHNVLKNYGSSLEKLPYEEESGVIENLMEDLEKPEIASATTELNLTEWITLLKNSNTEFINVYRMRNEKMADQGPSKVAEKRKDTQTAFTQLCDTINALAYIEGKDPYQHLANNINQQVKNTLDQTQHRGPRNTDNDN